MNTRKLQVCSCDECNASFEAVRLAFENDRLRARVRAARRVAFEGRRSPLASGWYTVTLMLKALDLRVPLPAKPRAKRRKGARR